jgi:hypothetical protein
LIPKLDHRALQPRRSLRYYMVITLPNPTSVPIVSYEYLFCHLTSDRLRPPVRQKARRLLSGFCPLGTAGHRLRLTNMDTLL